MIKHNIEIKDLLNKKIICIGTGKIFSNLKNTFRITILGEIFK